MPPQHGSVSYSRDIAVRGSHQENTDNSGTAASQAMDDVYGDSTDRDEGFYEE